jgi:xanthine dehydrogenase accessory factor
MDAGEIAEAVLAARRGGPAVLVATVIAAPEAEGERVGAKMLVRRDGSAAGTLGGEALDEAVKRESADVYRRHGVEVVYLRATGERVERRDDEAGDAYQVMLEVHESPASLLIIGGGHVGKALATIGDLCGFSVEIVDDRPEYANEERFPEADKITCGRFEDVLADYPIDANTYVVCVTRGHRHDETSLRLVAESGAAYIGMIGSKRRVGAVLQHLVEEGVDPVAVERVHTPIGLDIGAETPEEIAVSVMAEIIMARRGGSGGSMRAAKGKKHGVAPAERLTEQ